MQKLVKRRTHYETIVPVEAYHPEDDTWQDEISLGLTIAGGILAFTNPWVGVSIAATGVTNHFFHDEIVDGLEFMAEAEMERQNIEQENDEALHQGIVNTVETIVEGVEALDDGSGGAVIGPPNPNLVGTPPVP